MICETERKGKDCSFMKKTGCNYVFGKCFPIVEKCKDCKKIETFGENNFCNAYMKPEIVWRTGCALTTTRVLTKDEIKKINPLKASKKANKGRKK